MVDMAYIKTRFLTPTNIKSWCESYAKEHNAKAIFEIVDHRTHTQITADKVATMLYNNRVPAYRNTYNLRSFTQDKAVFYLTVKGLSVVMVCHFVYPSKKIDGYQVEHNGQLRLDL